MVIFGSDAVYGDPPSVGQIDWDEIMDRKVRHFFGQFFLLLTLFSILVTQMLRNILLLVESQEQHRGSDIDE